MIIQCTNAMLEKIDVNLKVLNESERLEMHPLGFWHAHFVKVDRKNLIILINDLTYYTVVLYRPNKKDFSNMERLINRAIRNALQIDGYNESVIDAYFNASPSVIYTKYSSRAVLGKFTVMKRMIGYSDYLDSNTLIQRYVGPLINSYAVKMDDGQEEQPQKRMQESLQKYFGHESAEQGVIRRFKHYELTVKLDLEPHVIYRRISVPSYFTFRQLSNCILSIFDWFDYHLHEFLIERKDHKSLIIQMLEDPDRLFPSEEESMELKVEHNLSLEEVFGEEPLKMSYIYDFGDYWEHEIIIDRVTEREERLPIFLGGEGERPPEDVGGLGGYESYLEIIADKEHPEYESMVEWASYQRERKATEEEMNRTLQFAFYRHLRY